MTTIRPIPLYVGTSGWAYPVWKPRFYPQNLPAKNFLKHYATRLSAVEVNYTFRRILSVNAAESWLVDVPPDFQFVPKANWYITHVLRLKGVSEALERFLPTLEPLRRRKQLGPVLFQLPPNFRADVPLLRDFLVQLPRNLKYAMEFRHESWFTDATYRALKRRNVALCVAETDTVTTPEERTAKFIYFRFRRPSYKPRECKQLADRVERCLVDGLETYAFFKHEDDPRSPLSALELLKTVRKRLAA